MYNNNFSYFPRVSRLGHCSSIGLVHGKALLNLKNFYMTLPTIIIKFQRRKWTKYFLLSVLFVSENSFLDSKTKRVRVSQGLCLQPLSCSVYINYLPCIVRNLLTSVLRSKSIMDLNVAIRNDLRDLNSWLSGRNPSLSIFNFTCLSLCSILCKNWEKNILFVCSHYSRKRRKNIRFVAYSSSHCSLFVKLYNGEIICRYLMSHCPFSPYDQSIKII